VDGKGATDRGPIMGLNEGPQCPVLHCVWFAMCCLIVCSAVGVCVVRPEGEVVCV